ncbi:MAG: L(+)-tartrate dehydratase subunit beta [Treponema sp.]|nr:L(+)-tartrate dehydratase subunit beta [Treponema sp.]
MTRLLHTRLRDTDITDLRIGDIVFLSGILVTGRDAVHRRILREGMECPADLKGIAIFHAGPIVRENPPSYELISVGPTTSSRMEEYAPDFMARTGIKMMIGKGGMGNKTAAGCREHKVLHCVYPGGCAVLGAGQVENIENVFWRELGMPECLWVMRVREFGPLIVSIDTMGNNMFTENAAHYASRRDACMAPIIESLRF